MNNNINSVEFGNDPPKRKHLNRISYVKQFEDIYQNLLFRLDFLGSYSSWLTFSFDDQDGARKLRAALPALAYEEHKTKKQELWSWRYQTQLHKVEDQWVLWVRKVKVV